jgi:hypothetical protein
MQWAYLKRDTVQTRSETNNRSVLKRVASLQLRYATRFHHFAIKIDQASRNATLAIRFYSLELRHVSDTSLYISTKHLETRR